MLDTIKLFRVTTILYSLNYSPISKPNRTSARFKCTAQFGFDTKEI